MEILHAHQMKKVLIAPCAVQRVTAFQKDQMKTTTVHMRMVSGSHLILQSGLTALVSLTVVIFSLCFVKWICILSSNVFNAEVSENILEITIVI